MSVINFVCTVIVNLLAQLHKVHVEVPRVPTWKCGTYHRLPGTLYTECVVCNTDSTLGLRLAGPQANGGGARTVVTTCTCGGTPPGTRFFISTLEPSQQQREALCLHPQDNTYTNKNSHTTSTPFSHPYICAYICMLGKLSGFSVVFT